MFLNVSFFKLNRTVVFGKQNLKESQVRSSWSEQNSANSIVGENIPNAIQYAIQRTYWPDRVPEGWSALCEIQLILLARVRTFDLERPGQFAHTAATPRFTHTHIYKSICSSPAATVGRLYMGYPHRNTQSFTVSGVEAFRGFRLLKYISPISYDKF